MAAVRVAPPGGGLHGVVRVPGDKSIAHRALLLGALAEGTTLVGGFPGGGDTLSTLAAVTALGARVARDGADVHIEGAGAALGARGELRLDCGNSGTTMRLGAGLVAGGPGTIVLDGDASLRRRPMARVAAPLRAMGAAVETTDGHAPLRIRGGALRAIDFTPPVASAQVKSAVLLAALRAQGTTRVHEPLASRDHTERMLPQFGVALGREGDAIVLAGGQRLRGAEVACPGDPSSAAFLVVAALLVPGSEVVLPDVGLNPTRTGFLRVLARMGAQVAVGDVREVAGEPRGTLTVRACALRGTDVLPADAPATIDELPILAVAAALADGETTIAGAAELRVKESDRIAALEQLRALGVPIRATADGLVVRGSAGRPLGGGRIVAHGDHRIAMAFAVAGLAATGGVTIDDPAAADVSFPGFFACLAALGAPVEAR